MTALSIAGLAVVVFASTNVDDIFVLLAFFADPYWKTRHIVMGQYLGIGILYGVSVLGSSIARFLRPEFVGILGIVPILIGAKRLFKTRSFTDPEPELPSRANQTRMFGVTAVILANGGDNIAVYTPLFAIRTASEIIAVGIIFALMTALWLIFARWLVHYRFVAAPIRRYGNRIVPFLLIAIGLLVMLRAGTFRLL